MSDSKKNSADSGRMIRKLVLVIYDIFAVNIAYYGALLIRFYVNGEFHLASTIYPPLFVMFAPWYTLCCIIVFIIFKLYKGMWRYAGLDDFNRILYANICTFLIQLLGTLLFVHRMPLTYYGLGAIIQFILICISRFSFRLFRAEKSKYELQKFGNGINMMIVGVGETANILLRQLEGDSNNLGRPVCVVDYRNHETGRLFDGLPVVGAVESIPAAVKKYGVKVVILADSLMPADVRKTIREKCRELDVNVQDFSGFSQQAVSGVALKRFLEMTSGSVEIRMGDIRQQFDNGEQAALTVNGRYVVKHVWAESNLLLIEIEKDVIITNNVDEEWVREYENMSGSEISFF